MTPDHHKLFFHQAQWAISTRSGWLFSFGLSICKRTWLRCFQTLTFWAVSGGLRISWRQYVRGHSWFCRNGKSANLTWIVDYNRPIFGMGHRITNEHIWGGHWRSPNWKHNGCEWMGKWFNFATDQKEKLYLQNPVADVFSKNFLEKETQRLWASSFITC